MPSSWGMGGDEIGAGLSRTRTGLDFTAGRVVHAMNARRSSVAYSAPYSMMDNMAPNSGVLGDGD